MASLISEIQPKLTDGFELQFYKAGAGRGIWRLYKNGRPYLERGLKQVTINDSNDGFNYRRRVVKQLEECGALPVSVKRKPKEPEARVTNYAVETTTAVEMARTILKDPKANPRERKMAKAYLDLIARYARTAKLVKRLNERLDSSQSLSQ